MTLDIHNKKPSYNLNIILNKLLENETYSDVAKKINVSVGTVKRWDEIGVPKSYTFELLKMSKIEIDYSKFTSGEKDQFFTPKCTVEYCYSKFIEVLKVYKENYEDYTFIEPSAGDGSFLNVLPKNRRIGLDIEPRNSEVIKQDYLDWRPSDSGKYVVIGNPPFGLRGQLALKFINHSSEFADYVCFILPQLFESDGKGVPRKRVIGLNLVYSEKLHTDFKSPEGKNIKIQCIFQIWSKYHKNDDYKIKKLNNNRIKIYSISDGGTPSTTRNKEMFYKCDVYLPSTCFGKDNMKYYDNFEELPRKKGYGIVFIKDKEESLKKFKDITWSDVAFLSTNSAYNIRSSQIIYKFME